MNLQALQYIDISSAIAEGLHAGEHELNAALVQRMEGSAGERYVVVEGPRCKAEDPSANRQTSARPLYLKAQPVFSNSLLSTEVLVCLTDADLAVRQQVNRVNTAKNGSNIIDIPMDSELHYRLQDPLPEYLGAQMYREGRRLVLILDDPSRLAMADRSLVLNLQQTLLEQHDERSPNGKVQISCFIDSNSLPFNNQTNPFAFDEDIKFHKISNPCHRLNVIGKSHLVLCDSPGIAVDAIRSSVPAVFLGGVPAGYDKVQESVENFLHHGVQHQLLAEQQSTVEGMLLDRPNTHYIMSNQSTLQSLIANVKQAFFHESARLSEKSLIRSADVPKSVMACKASQGKDTLILNTQHTLCRKTTNTVRLKSSLASSRRKYQKFRESPVRFMEDSHSSILRYLAANRTS